HDQNEIEGEEYDEEEIIEEILSEEQVKFGSEFVDSSTSTIPIRHYDATDISVVLLMIKKKHKCTNSLMIDILRLLRILKVSNVPSSWHKLKQLIGRTDEELQEKQQMIESILYFCPERGQQSNNQSKCTNPNCSYNTNTSQDDENEIKNDAFMAH
ncbi:unnamed protein product, partial [Didymodactylos carnosus]